MTSVSQESSIGPVSAVIVRARDGGPIRRIVSGRRDIPTGHYPAMKANAGGMPEESPAEVMAMQICEVSTAVHGFLAQPHRLEMQVWGGRWESGRPMIYFPDLEIKAERRLADQLERRRPFGLAAFEWTATLPPTPDLVTIVAEVKRPDDPRLSDPLYIRKLQLAHELYRDIGFHFTTIEDRDLTCVDGRLVRRIVYDTFVKIDTVDIYLALEFIASKGGVAELADLQQALGECGQAKSHALQIRRIISLDVLSYSTGSARVIAVR
jgi:hypothetical protein